jgi:hypothetical protein
MARQYIPVELKNQVFDRAKGICEYCYSQAKFSPNNFEMLQTNRAGVVNLRQVLRERDQHPPI